MAGVERNATVTWQGSLSEGSGTITGSTSGTVRNLDVSWAARTGDHGGKTSPEELIAAAHASCFSMALSVTLEQNGTPPTTLDVSATATFEVEGGPRISGMVLDVTGKVDGVDQATFEQMAQQAGQNCPVSGALKGNVPIEVNAKLG